MNFPSRTYVYLIVKIMCIKFGDKHISSENNLLNNSEFLSGTNNIRHVGNFIDCSI